MEDVAKYSMINFERIFVDMQGTLCNLKEQL